MGTFNTIVRNAEAVYKVNGSKFIAKCFFVNNEFEAKAIIEKHKKKFHDATHVCSAYVIGMKKEISKSSDDGEPSGTAGKPMLGQLTANNLSNTLILVIRYFGGTKLGTGGLMQAYKEVSRLALLECGIVKHDITQNVNFKCDYHSLGRVLYFAEQARAKLISNVQAENNHLIFEVPIEEFNKFMNNIKPYSICENEKRY